MPISRKKTSKLRKNRGKINPKSLDNLKNSGNKKKESGKKKETKTTKKKESIPVLIPKVETKKKIWKNPMFWAGVLAATTGVMFLMWKIKEMRKEKLIPEPEVPEDIRKINESVELMNQSEEFLNEQ